MKFMRSIFPAIRLTNMMSAIYDDRHIAVLALEPTRRLSIIHRQPLKDIYE
jgi:hypothetical protein